MTELYVRMEAVNLTNFVEDVHDLSTIRGGSFLLLEAVGEVQRRFGLERISTGASAGLFSIASEQSPDEVRGNIETFLHDHDRYKHATFVVDVSPVSSFERDRESLTAMNRWRQFQQPTLAVPSTPAKPSNEECGYDHVRPASKPMHTSDGKKMVSDSVHVRRTEGRERKQQFYGNELKALRAPDDRALGDLIDQIETTTFANDLEALTSDPDRGSLHLKMAVLYFDGNGFGKRQFDCGAPEELTALDTAIKTCRRKALRRLLETIFSSRDNGWWTSSGEVRLETLLWGGDEVIWVVPAWKGWEAARLFYEQTQYCEHSGKALTHAGGVVFSHHAAPIHRMRRTAIDLADLCKDFLERNKPGEGHAESDLFAYQVFESFDLIEGDLANHRKSRAPLGREKAGEELLVRAAGMGSVAAGMEIVRRGFPRSKLHDIVLAFTKGDAGALADATAGKLPTETREALKNLFHFFGRTTDESPWKTAPTGWFHIAELWDYAVAPAPAKEVRP